jgi:hypothetical protein
VSGAAPSRRIKRKKSISAKKGSSKFAFASLQSTIKLALKNTIDFFVRICYADSRKAPGAFVCLKNAGDSLEPSAK